MKAGSNMDDPVRRYMSGDMVDRMDHYTQRSADCWLWVGTDDGHGYGLVWDAETGSNRYAHVVAWELAHNKSTGDQIVRHQCDIPLCVRPDHLRIGSHADNVHDCIERDRRNPSPIFTRGQLQPSEVRQIRKLHDSGLTNAEIARQFGTTRVTVSRVVRRLVFDDID